MATRRTLLIVGDHTLFREGLKTIISRNPAYEVVGETGWIRPSPKRWFNGLPA